MDTIPMPPSANRIYRQGKHDIITYLLDELPAHIARIEYEPQAITTLDDQLNLVMDAFSVSLSQPHPPFQLLCRLLKATNKYLNLRGLIQQQVDWGQTLLRYFLDNPEAGSDMDITVLVIIASGFERLGYIEDAIDLYEYIIALFDEDPTNQHLGAIYYNLALAYQKNDDIPQAIEASELAIRIDERYDDKRGIAINLMHLADLHFSLDDKKAGFTHMKQAIQVIERLNNPSILALYTGKLAFFMAKYEDFEKAIPLFESAMRQWELVGDDEQRGQVTFNYAVLLYETGRIAEAYRYAYDSLTWFEKSNSVYIRQVREALSVWEQADGGHSMI